MPSADEKIAKLREKQQRLLRKVTDFTTWWTKNQESDEAAQFAVRWRKLQSTHDEFENLAEQIEDIAKLATSKSENLTFDQAVCVTDLINFERVYFHLETAYQNQIANKKKDSNKSPTSIKQNQNSLQLKPINIQAYYGSYTEWLPFYNTFKTLVHDDENLNNIQKFHHLKECLKGDAASVLSGLPISAGNYPTAWLLLKERFQHTRLIAQHHINNIFNLPTVQKDSATSLRHLTDTLVCNLESIKSLQIKTESWDPLLNFLITSKLDYVTRKTWEESLTTTSLPTFAEFLKFLRQRCNLLEAMEVNKGSKSQGQPFHEYKVRTQNKPFHQKVETSRFASQSKVSCFLCKQPHRLYSCPELLKLPIKARIAEVRKLKVCANCLKGTHTVNECMSSGCRTCGYSHNTLLHLERSHPPQEKPEHKEPPRETPARAPEVANGAFTKISPIISSKQILLSTAVIKVASADGQLHDVRAVLDPGSTSHFILEETTQRLGLKTSNVNVPISGINQSKSVATKQAEVHFTSKHSSYSKRINCLVSPNITERLPLVSFSASNLKISSDLKLADPHYNISSPVEMLIGAELFLDLLCIGQFKASKHGPTVQKTKLGWILAGSHFSTTPTSTVCNFSNSDLLHHQVSKFWEIEEAHVPNAHWSPEEKACEAHFTQNTRRDDTGRFIVSLPFRENKGELGLTRDVALKRFYSTERQLARNSNLKTGYTEFMSEYEDLKHMQFIANLDSSNPDSTNHFYLPHHPVIKESSLTTRIRVVYDGSAKSSSGISLNDALMVGPTIQQDVFSILNRFRTHQLVITADISKMYRQILVSEKDRDHQRILWREDSSKPIKIYKLNTITYGTGPASFLATRCLKQLADEEMHNFPQTCEVIRNDFYVDDILTGGNDVNQVRILRDQLITVLNSGGFPLSKWAANDPILLSEIQNQSDQVIINIDGNKNSKTLGLLWNSEIDSLTYSFTPRNECNKVTKRSILSTTAQIFDPLGLIGPVIVNAKILLQKLWQLKLDWDESVPMEIYSLWMGLLDQFRHLNNFRIPHKVINVFPYHAVEIHCFSDSSEVAYGAAIYLRTIDFQGDISISLLTAKSRVAPLKNISLPRLELCGALLMAQLADKVIKTINLQFSGRFYWTDSQVVLAWIAGNSNKWKTFVANRVAQIHDLTSRCDWHHVSSHDNPADLISRGATAEDLKKSDLWWTGPSWLRDSEQMPDNFNRSINELLFNDDQIPEKRKIAPQVSIITHPTHENELRKIIERHQFKKIIRVTAYVLRFISNIKNKKDKRNCQALSGIETQAATNHICKYVQAEAFSEELSALQAKRPIPNKSKLLSLSPFLDENDIIRVGGRLNKAKIRYGYKHPIALPKTHLFTQRLITHYHEKMLHAGVQGTLSAVRQSYWPLSCKNIIKQVIRKCIPCFRANPIPGHQLMGDLPEERLHPGRPFCNTGVDYAGPITIREGRHRGRPRTIKSYIALFVCFATKALHLELVTDCTSESFLNALKRFISRRGMISKIVSDNGTTFIGANRELVDLYTLLRSKDFQSRVIDPLATEGITWQFNSPKAPHHGGLWEAGVKSVKHHLKRVSRDALLTYEEMQTLLYQIEACLNSRPILPLSNDPNDLSALSPSHFLVGGPLTCLPESDLTNTQVNRLSRWQMVTQLQQHFWKRWSHDYLNTLQSRTKWKVAQPEHFHEGVLVVIKEDTVPPLMWHLGRIVQTHPGADGLVRVASVKTAHGTYKRPITKLCILPVHEDDHHGVQ